MAEEGAAPGMRALERGLAVIRAFAEAEEPLSVSEVSRRTGLDRAVIRRVLGTLERLTYVGQAYGGWVLQPPVLELGYAYLSSDPRPAVAEMRMRPVAEELQESCSFGVLDHHRVVYLSRVEIKRIAGPSLAIGSVLEPTLTSIGRTLLAYASKDEVDEHLEMTTLRAATPHTTTDPNELRTQLAQVREQGWCLVAEELELGLLALAMPVYGRDQRLVGAANVTSHTSRMSAEAMLENVLPRLREAVEAISRDLLHAYV